MRLPGSDKVIVGYDLGKDYAQISCYVTGREEEITTLSSVAGSQVYTIPLVLSKRQGVNQWFYGSEALRHAEEEEGTGADRWNDSGSGGTTDSFSQA